MKVKNIQTRLLLGLIPLILVVLIALSGVSYYLAKQSLLKSVDDTGRAVGTDYSNRVQADMEKMIVQLEDLASIQRIRAGTDKVQITEAMSEMQKRLGIFDVVAFISPDGSGVINTGQTASYNDREYFKKVVATKKAVVSDPLVSKVTGKLAVVLAVPVMNNGQLTGVLIGTFSMEKLSEMMKELKFLETGYGQVADDSGMVIAHPKQPDLVGKLNLLDKKINPELKLPQSDLDERLTNIFKVASKEGKQSRGVYSFVDGVERVAVATPINLPGDQRWVVIVAAPEVEATRQVDSLTKMMLLISVICLLIAVAAILFIAKQFVKPILVIRDECLLLAEGDLREREAKVSSEDEIGQLAKGFREMRTNLRELVTKVHSQSEQLAASSEELTASADQSAQAANQVAISITDVANGSQEQLTAANETSAVVEGMSASIEQISATTNEVAEQSSQTANKANEGNKAVNKAVIQMKQIEQTVQTSAQAVAELGERSKEIGQIVATISGIAGQTNLLALNAAIEAARAGEQGRGFAVVAEEVRKLAEQSQEATKQIASLISGIQGDTDKAVMAMDDGTREVKLGAEVVDAAGQAFQEIVIMVTQVSNQVREISSSIDQMAIGSQQIVESVNRIDSLSKKATEESQTVSAATEEQSASMEEIASSSQSLANLAMDLREAVTRFRV
ncbi:methyl-accepting chemotaxis protein [Pelosinus sp. UFO1]|uniref:methyl-accepting chemotaxis protein n=1 Tax=Pelosinus sp. UFO1 TaxID=484770 RepID=UPI0004D0D669|nr:methyl-accepting chemotaxis protein [Pelosinus sp. UFO1]AIF49869.1 methyl-accepting chemotaxis sensory transducer with Cache sensor [Pelosinus sp. UFO1]